MTNKSIISLGLILCVLLGLFFVSSNLDSAGGGGARSDQEVVQIEELGEIEKIQLADGDFDLNLKLVDGVWTVPQSSGYKADFGKIKSLILKVLRLNRSQAIPARSEAELADLGLSTDKPLMKLTLSGSKANQPVELLIGRKRGRALSEQFFRTKEDQGAFLTSETLDFEADPRSWLDRDIVDFKPERFSEIKRLSNEGRVAFTLVRGPDSSWSLDPKPVLSKEVNAANLALIYSSLDKLQFDGVIKKSSKEAKEIDFSYTTNYLANDGFLVEVQAGRLPETKQVAIQISFSRDEARVKALEEKLQVLLKQEEVDGKVSPEKILPVTEDWVETRNLETADWVYLFDLPENAENKWSLVYSDMVKKKS